MMEAREFDKIINNLEFENQQYVKQIEKEKQEIEAVECQVHEYRAETIQLQEATSILDEDMKRYHRQLLHYRDTFNSLRKTPDVLSEHEAALNNSLQMLVDGGQQEKEDHARTLEYYKKIWLDYKASYERFPLAKVLKEKKTSRDHSEVTLSEIKIKHQATKERIDNLMKGETFMPYLAMKDFIIKLAEINVQTLQADAAVSADSTECTTLETKISQKVQERSGKHQEELERKQDEEGRHKEEDPNLEGGLQGYVQEMEFQGEQQNLAGEPVTNMDSNIMNEQQALLVEDMSRMIIQQHGVTRSPPSRPNEPMLASPSRPNEPMLASPSRPNEPMLASPSRPNEPMLASPSRPNEPMLASPTRPNEPMLVSPPRPNQTMLVSSPSPSQSILASLPTPNQPMLASSTRPNQPILVPLSRPSQTMLVSLPRPNQPMMLSSPKPVGQQPVVSPSSSNQKMIEIPARPNQQMNMASPRPNHLMEAPRPNQLIMDSPRPNQLIMDSPRPNQLIMDSPRPNQLIMDSLRPNQLIMDSPRPNQLIMDSPRPNQLIVEAPRPNQPVLVAGGRLNQLSEVQSGNKSIPKIMVPQSPSFVSLQMHRLQIPQLCRPAQQSPTAQMLPRTPLMVPRSKAPVPLLSPVPVLAPRQPSIPTSISPAVPQMSPSLSLRTTAGNTGSSAPVVDFTSSSDGSSVDTTNKTGSDMPKTERTSRQSETKSPKTPHRKETSDTEKQPKTPKTPKTPGNQGSGQLDVGSSPFDLDKHRARMKQLQSPGANFSYSSRPMFTKHSQQETESTIRNEDTRDDLPFAHTFLAPPADPIGGGEPNKGKPRSPQSAPAPTAGEALFGGGDTGDGFASGFNFSMGENASHIPKEQNMFGDSTAPGDSPFMRFSFSTNTVDNMFGSKSSGGFNFGGIQENTNASPAAPFSMFGGGDTQEESSEAEGDVFSFSFGGEPQESASATLNLF